MAVLAHSRRLEARIRGLSRDTTSGAAEMAESALAILCEARPANRRGPADEYVRAVTALARRIALSRPSVGAVATSVGLAVAGFRAAPGKEDDSGAAFEALGVSVETVLGDLRSARDRTAARFAGKFGRLRRVLTISYSSTVVAALSLRARDRSVVVCESRPKLEGRRTARLLRDAGCRKVTIVTDAGGASALGSVAAVVFGCDAIRRDGSVVNKLGSALLASAARQLGKRVIVLGDSFKFSGRGAFDAEAHAPAEVWRSAPPGINVKNEYFEVVPPQWIDWIVLEDDVVEPPGVRGPYDAIMRRVRGLNVGRTERQER